ncbi:ABC transporter membrane protein [Streptococcus pneumoniae]|nr:ABC transporter membrane protein [Streptococcus pneumoniae]
MVNVDPALVEAARLDGANIFQRIWHIDIPALKPIMVIQFVLAAGGIMNVGYEKAFLMQTSLNLPTSEIISTLINVVLLVAVNQIVKRMNNGEGI